MCLLQYCDDQELIWQRYKSQKNSLSVTLGKRDTSLFINQVQVDRVMVAEHNVRGALINAIQPEYKDYNQRRPMVKLVD